MARTADLLVAIDRLYAAAREPSGWMAALDAVTDLVDAGHTIVVAGNPFDRGFALGARVDESAVANLLSIRREDVNDGLDIDDLPDGRLVLRSRLIPDRIFERTRYYNEIVRPLDGFHSFFYRRLLGAGGFTLAVCRSPRAKRFGAAEEAALATLLPHVDNAVDLHDRLRAAELQDGSLVRLVDSIASGVVLTDENGGPLFMNASAGQLIAEADGLVLGAGGLAAARPVATERLRSAIGCAATPPDFRIHRLAPAEATARTRLCLERPSGRAPLMVTVLPVWGIGGAIPGGGEARAAVFIDEPDGPVQIDSEAIAEAFRLTRREAELACLIGEGHDLAGAARILSLGIGTARNHLKRVFQKTGIHSQAALVALARGYAAHRRHH